MEEIEIHSRSYLLRWVHAKSNTSISWTVQPHKRSINLGLFKHPGALASLPTVAGLPSLQTAISRNEDGGQQPEIVDKLEAIGLKQVIKLGKCEADKFNQGRYDVPSGEGGHFALVFDNTFSKTTGKMATFFLLTFPTSARYQISFGAQLHHSQAMASAMAMAPPSTGRRSPRARAKDKQSLDSLKLAAEDTPRTNAATSTSKLALQESSTHAGVLQKRRRKKHQGYARRFFSLDYNSSTLSYYHDRSSSALRGAIPLSLAAIGANAKTREISIDSGAEIWHLRANNATDFAEWKKALERASKLVVDSATSLELDSTTARSPGGNDLNWERLETLLSKMSGTRDAVRRLATDALSSPLPPQSPLNDLTPGTPEREGDGYFPEERPRFWKRKPSHTDLNRNIFRRSVSAQLAVPIPAGSGSLSPQIPSSPARATDGMHDHLRQILNNLDGLIADFSLLVHEAKHRNGLYIPQSAVSRMSLDSQEYFDAEDETLNRSDSQLLELQDDESSDAEERTAESDTSSDVEDTATVGGRAFRSGSLSSLMPPPPKSLVPLPLDPVRRRNKVNAPTIMPPSLIGFLRKNVGKDLSTISMPVSANEPLSLLQKAAEGLEYSELLDRAVRSSNAQERLLHVAAFALSSFSQSRIKERSIRKPFNPMLGETYELVREDKNFRFVSEKVSHRPVQLACHAEGQGWSFSHSPLPSQKFWGKSSEIITEGKARLALHSPCECYSWSAATCFLRNIIAGEKYVEPVGTMSVVNETTGCKCVITFKAKGMFSGRSEELDVVLLDSQGIEQPLGLTGTWTSSLMLKENGKVGKEIWHVGSLVDRPEKHYGMTTFAAELNEVTPIEQGKLPPTDSRLRSDQRALEDGRYDDAERLKNEIEEGQRRRRREMEAERVEWVPKFFVKVNNGDEIVWKLKAGGPDGYWERRARGDWSEIIDVLGVD